MVYTMLKKDGKDVDIPGIGRFAILQDPQGAAFAVIKLENPQ